MSRSPRAIWSLRIRSGIIISYLSAEERDRIDRLGRTLAWWRKELVRQRQIWEREDTTDDEHCHAGECYKVALFGMRHRVKERHKLYAKAKRLARKGGMVI